jgi:hypothetical protein
MLKGEELRAPFACSRGSWRTSVGCDWSALFVGALRKQNKARYAMTDKNKKQEEVKYPEGEERLIPGGKRNEFTDFN